MITYGTLQLFVAVLVYKSSSSPLVLWLVREEVGVLKNNNRKIADMQLLVKCYDNKMVKSPITWVIYPLTQLQLANQKKNETCHIYKTLLF